MKYAGFQFVRTTPSHNKHAGKRKYLHGGTAVVYHDQLTHQVLATGADDRSLGRWSWMTLGGGNTGKVHVISAYQPCKVTGALRNLTVYKQQIKYCNENNIMNAHCHYSKRISVL